MALFYPVIKNVHSDDYLLLSQENCAFIIIVVEVVCKQSGVFQIKENKNKNKNEIKHFTFYQKKKKKKN